MRPAVRAVTPLGYLLLAVIGQWPALTTLSRQTRCACRDAPQTDWFLGWTPHALAHGHAPWTSAALAAPDGVNLMWNTLLPLPGLLMTPITLLAGPLASHTLLSVLAFAGSGTSMWWVAGRWAPWGPARLAAGLLYGFSPYLVAQGQDHLNLSLVALPPLLLACLDELLIRQRRRAVAGGLVLGLVALAQLLTTEEVLATCLLASTLGLLVLVGQHARGLDRARSRHALCGLSVAALILALGAAWPLGVQFLGPLHLTGPVTDATGFDADLLGIITPGRHVLLGAHVDGWGGGPTENGSYLGIPLLVALAVLVGRCRRLAVVRFACAAGAGMWVLSLGRHLTVAGTRYGLPLPGDVLSHAPLLENLAAVRLSLYVVLFAALLLAVGLDHSHATGRLGRGSALAALVIVASLLPNWPYASVDARVPTYFTTSAVRRIPAGALALTYPVPRFPDSAPMQWQALAGYRYRSVGGYLITSDGRGHGTFRGGVTAWERAVAPAAAGRGAPSMAGVDRLLLAEMRRLQVRAVLVADRPGAADVNRLVERVLGRRGEHLGGVTAWYL